jgi:hypothetical protein
LGDKGVFEPALKKALGIALILSLVGCSAATTPESSSPNSVEQDVTQPGIGQEPKGYPQVTLDNLEPLAVRELAFTQVRMALLASKPAPDLVNHVFTTNVNMTAANNAIEEIPLMAGFFSDVATVSDYTIIWTGKNGSPEVPKIACEEADFCENLPIEQYCSMGELVNLWVACQFNNKDENVFRMPVFHGYTHLVQSMVAPNAHMPSWFSEGPAQYFESHFAALHYFGSGYSKSAVDTPSILMMMMKNQDLVRFGKPATRKNVMDAMLAMENRMPRDGWEQAQLGYYLGYLATEVLIATSGLEKFNEFWRQTSEKDFYEAFEQEYGLTTKQFYKKFVPYALAWIEIERLD